MPFGLGGGRRGWQLWHFTWFVIVVLLSSGSELKNQYFPIAIMELSIWLFSLLDGWPDLGYYRDTGFLWLSFSNSGGASVTQYSCRICLWCNKVHLAQLPGLSLTHISSTFWIFRALLIIFFCKMIENTTNLYEKVEKEMSELVKCSVTFCIFHGINFFE